MKPIGRGGRTADADVTRCSGLCLFSSFRRAPASTRNNDAHFDLKSPWQTRLQQFSPRWLLASAAPYAPTWHDLTPTAVMLKASAIRPMAASASGLSQARRNEFRGSTSGWCLVMRRRRQVVCRFQIRDSRASCHEVYHSGRAGDPSKRQNCRRPARRRAALGDGICLLSRSRSIVRPDQSLGCRSAARS